MLELCHMCVLLSQICDLKDGAEKVISCFVCVFFFSFPLAAFSYMVLLVKLCNENKLLEITFVVVVVKYS